MGREEGEDGPAQGGREGRLGGGEELDAAARPLVGDAHERGVDGVDRGAGDEADDEAAVRCPAHTESARVRGVAPSPRRPEGTWPLPTLGEERKPDPAQESGITQLLPVTVPGH